MNKKVRTLFLLSVLFLAVVFIFWGFSSPVSAGEKKKASPFFSFQKKGEEIEISWKGISFQKEKKVGVKVHRRKGKEQFSKVPVYKEKIEIKQENKIKFSTEVEDSDFYYFKIELKQGKKKVEKIFKEPVYLKGNALAEEVISPNLRFVDDILEVRWEKTEGKTYRIGVYDRENLTLIQEEITTEDNIQMELPKEKKKISVGVSVIDEKGRKNDYSLVEAPDRELPNVMLKFLNKDILNKNEIKVDLLFTGNCSTEMEVNGAIEDTKIVESGRYQLKLSEGENIVKAIITSENGNVKTFRKSFLVDTVKPKIRLDTVINEAVTGDSFIPISGECNEEVSLSLNGKKLEVNEEGRFSVDFDLVEGENELKLVAEDKAGNVNNVRAIVRRETAHEPNKKVVWLVFGTFGIIFSAYLFTFIKWIFVRRSRKS